MAKNSRTEHPQAKQKPEMSPDSIPKVVVMLIKSFAKSIPKIGLIVLLKSIGIFLFIMWLNYYVVAVKNNGYGGGPVLDTQAKPWIWLFNIGKNQGSFNLLVFFSSLLLTSLWSQIRMHGLKKFFSNLIHFFHWIGYCAVEAGKESLPTLLFSMAIVMPLGLFAQNQGLFATIAVGSFFGFISQNKNLTYLFSRAGWFDIQRAFHKGKPLTEMNPGISGLLSLGFLLGAVILLLIPVKWLTAFSILLFVLFIVLGVMTKMRKIPPKAIAGMLVFIFVNLAWIKFFGRVYADDAGADELGTFSNYIKDPGGQQVLTNGVQPGILGVLGSWIGSAAGSVIEAGAYVGGKVVDGAKYVGGKVVNGAGYIGSKVVDGAGYIGGKVSDAASYIPKKIMGEDVWEGMWENIEKEVTEAEEQIGHAWEKTKEVAGQVVEDVKDFGKDVWNHPGIYVETLVNGTIGTIEETAALGWELVTNPQIVIDTIAGTTSDFISGAQKVGTAVVKGIYTTITDPQKAWVFVKDFVGYENFKNAFDPNRGLIDRISQYGVGVVKLVSAVSLARTVGAAGVKIAEKGVTTTLKTMADDLANAANKFVKTGKTGSPVGKYLTKGPADVSHMNQKQLNTFQKLLKKHGIDEASIRPGGSKRIMEKMANGEVLPKGHDIMNKTVNAIDEAFLGGPKNSQGLAAHFKPKLPSTETMKKMDTDTFNSVWKRYLQRYDEFNKQSANIKQLTTPRTVQIGGKTVNIPAKLVRDSNGVLRDAVTKKPFGSDWDLFDMISKGERTPRSVQSAFINDCKRHGLPIEHGSLADWVNGSDFNKEAYGHMIRDAMDKGIISVGQDGMPVEKVLQEFLKAAQ